MEYTADDALEDLRIHVCFELQSLLIAGTCWLAEERGTKPTARADYLTGLAQDSAFVHARNLFEFFTDKNENEQWLADRGLPFGGATTRKRLDLPRQHSSLWKEYRDAVMRKVFHMSSWRPHAPGEPDGRGAADDLQHRAFDFAQEALRCWDAMLDESEEPSRSVLAEGRRKAIEQSTRATTGYGIDPAPFE